MQSVSFDFGHEELTTLTVFEPLFNLSLAFPDGPGAWLFVFPPNVPELISHITPITKTIESRLFSPFLFLNIFTLPPHCYSFVWNNSHRVYVELMKKCVGL